MAHIVVLLPCLNEQQNLPDLLRRLEQLDQPEAGMQVSAVVVDDGSADRTAEIAADWQGSLQVQLIQHETNRGLGVALNTGLSWFTTTYSGVAQTALAVMDADGTHPPELLIEMADEPADVVIASRYASGGAEHGLSALRRFYSRLACSVLRLIAPVRGVKDYTCGYRLYRQPILAKAQSHYGDNLINERGFVCMAELLIKLARRGAVFNEVGLDLHYELKGGASKMNVPATISRYLALALNVLFNPRWR